ncbi:MAG: branched-chain amino acid ABC transporter permease [Actinobacteria bacterium]|nr:branched-chain amino acid ABC transporter permease [Actinomycetota bacterium]
MTELLNAVAQGILLGGLYALFATGLSIAFGVMRLVNLAHGDLSILAAFAAFSLVSVTGMNPLLSALVLLPVFFVLGYALQRWVLNFTLTGDVLPPLLVTFGVAVIIQNLLLETYSANNRGLDIGGLETASVRLTDSLAIGWFPLITFLVGVAVLVTLQLFLSRTRLGRAFRATSDDPEAARLVGIDNRHVFGLAFGVAIATVALAGVFLGIRTTFTPTIGPARLIFAFEAVIIGGLGSLWGTLAGGVVLGMAHTLGAMLSPGWSILAGHLVFLTVLGIKPNGLFGKGEPT